jgi:Putative zinc-finger
MSNEHVTHETLTRLRSRRLAPGELLTAVAHLETCVECAARAKEGAPGAMRAVEGAITSDEEHLDPQSQLFPYIDGTADAAEREIVESHIDDCAMCRAELADLRTLRRAPRQRMRAAYAAAAVLALLAITILLILRRPAPTPVDPPAPAPVVRDAPPAPPITTTTPAVHANAEWSNAVRDAVARKALPFPRDLRELRPAEEVLRGSGEAGEGVLSPAGVVVRETRPRFTWPEQANAEEYEVTIFRGEKEVARSGPLKQTSWQPERPLERGVTYMWQVEVIRDGAIDVLPAPPEPPAMFRIVRSEDDASIRAALRERPDDHLLHAVLYARAGLRGDAMRALRRAASAGNQDAAALLNDAAQRR